MTDPLSPEEIARRRTASYFVKPADAGEEMRRLLDIATDHARLVRMRDAGEGAAVTRTITPSCGHSYDPRRESACPSCLVELRAENAKLRERVGGLGDVVKCAAAYIAEQCKEDPDPETEGELFSHLHLALAALAACDEEK